MPKLILVASQAELPRIVSALKQCASPTCLNSGELDIWESRTSPSQLSSILTNENANWDEVGTGTTVVATKGVVGVPLARLNARGCPTTTVAASHFFEQQYKKLDELLFKHGFSWRNHGQELHRAYDHRSQNFDTESWLDQFRRIGAYDLGRQIVRVSRVMPTDQCVRDLVNSHAAIQPGTNDLVAVLSRLGKSGGALAGGLRRNIQKEFTDLSTCIDSCDASQKTIHVFEDALWTGIELQRVIDSLRGKSGKPKLQPLRDPASLDRHEVVLHFSVMTDLGIFAGQSILENEKLPNFRIANPDRVSHKLLTPRALELFQNRALTFADIRDFRIGRDHITPEAIQLLRDILDADQILNAERVLTQIGKQLWEINHPVAVDSLPPEMREHLGFGANGIGATFAFRHSAPRASLPVLWASGPVKWGKQNFQWNALFPEDGEQDHSPTAASEPNLIT